jgi:hypothetical protein
LLFPFEFNLFGHTFSLLNDWGVPGWFGAADLPSLEPQEGPVRTTVALPYQYPDGHYHLRISTLDQSAWKGV